MPDFNITIVSADKITVQETGETLLSVQYSIFHINDEGVVQGDAVHTGREGFPLGTTEDEVLDAVRKILRAYVKDQRQAARIAKNEEDLKVTDTVIENIVGMEISTDKKNDRKKKKEDIISEEVKG